MLLAILGPMGARVHDDGNGGIGWMEAGDVVDTHAHYFPHPQWILSGRFLVEGLAHDNGPVDWSKIVSGDDPRPWVQIPAGKFHRLTCLERGRYVCLWMHRDPTTGEITDVYNGNEDASV